MTKVKIFRFKGEDTRYAVSEYGEITNISTNKKLKYYIDNAGYVTVNVAVNKEVVKLKIHLVVNELFNTPRPEGFVVNHKDHNKLNNHYSNLENITYSENTRLWHVNRKTKFTEAEMLTIKDDCKITNIILKEELNENY